MERTSASLRKQKPINRATRIGVAAIDILCGLAGVEHGVGEILQGNTPTSGVSISAWEPPSALFGKEPAITIVPNFLVTGVLAIIVSLMVLTWAVAFVQRKNGAIVLILLSIMQLFVGGGIAPIFPAMAAGVTATRISSPLNWWHAHLPVGVRSFLAKLWPFFLVTFLVMFSSLLFSRYIYGDDVGLITNVGYAMLGVMLLAVIAGLAYDTQRRSTK